MTIQKKLHKLQINIKISLYFLMVFFLYSLSFHCWSDLYVGRIGLNEVHGSCKPCGLDNYSLSLRVMKTEIHRYFQPTHEL